MFLNSGQIWRTSALCILIFGCTTPQKNASNQNTANRYAEHVRSTEFQTAAQQAKGFKLPPGFEITLFASEPQIGKPMNMEFDDRGRLWITQSTEYPMAASEANGKDKIMILEDTDGDGKADKFTDFKSDLNIPIGIMPMADGAIAYSIPNVYYFRDTDNDGKADQTEKLLGPFGYSDTHGMVNNFVRGFDGWIQSSHGFSNTSRVAGKDGDSLVMVSGNTFRFRTDGSRAEQTTYGRVNPFGFAYDEKGYLYSVDCHSKPLYQLIPQADYPHFGKKPTGIGFAPEMTRYELGSTALSGLVYYTGKNFPESHRNNFFIGDVVTSRISRNSVSYSGSTPTLKFEEDFLLSEDPWFRPVDIKLGPDGAIYVADFYNRIIGHYEVDLKHPGRDRTSGRIWRITYKGGEKDPVARKDWSKASLEELLTGLNHHQLNIRMRIADRIYDSFGEKAVKPLTALLSDSSKSWESRVQALWLLHRLDRLNDSLKETVLKQENEHLRIHVLRVLAEKKKLPEPLKPQVIASLKDPSPFIRRTAAEVLGKFPAVENLTPLIELNNATDAADNHLQYTSLLAVRQNLANATVARQVISQNRTPAEEAVIAKAAVDLPDKTMANFVLAYLLKQEKLTIQTEGYLGYVASMVSNGQTDELAKKAITGLAVDDPAYLNRLEMIGAGLQQSGRASTPELSKLSSKAAVKVVDSYSKVNPGELHALDKGKRKMLETAMGLVGRFGIKSLDESLLAFLPVGYPLEFQQAAANALVRLSPVAYTTVFESLINSPATINAYKEKLVGPIAANPSLQHLQTLRRNLAGGSRNLQIEILAALLHSDDGVALMTEALEKGEAPVDILQVRRIKTLVDERLAHRKNQSLEALLAKSENSTKELEDLLTVREAGVAKYKGSPDKGRVVFMNNCASCHQIKGTGGVVGPQLDGIGNWGAKALTEKVLSPNRNITEAFKTYQINLKSGEKRLGLYRRTEGASMVFVDHAGQEFTVTQDDIEDYFTVNMTIMPDQFRYTIPESDFYELMTYLTSVK